MMPKISIIVPVYNAEKNLKKCISSIQTQLYENIEIILVNDGSKDNSLSICRDFEKTDNRVKVFDEQNAGVSCARNKGIAAATGDYIAFVDADDVVSENIYVDLLDKAMSGYEMVFCNYSEFNDEGYRVDVDQLRTLGIGEADSRLVISRLICISEDALFGVVWRTLFKTSLIKDNDVCFTPNLTMAEDLQFLLKCLKFTNKVGLCPKCLYNFKVSNQSTTGKYMRNQDRDMRIVNDWLLEYVKEFSDNKELIMAVEICKANTLVLNVANVCKTCTPYSFWGRIKYAHSLSKEPQYFHALRVALEHKEQIVKKRYIQMLSLRYNLSFVNVLFHSLKNRTLFRKNK